MKPGPAALLCVAGLSVTLLVCAALGVPPSKGIMLVGVSSGAALLVGLLGTAVLRPLTRAGFAVQMAVVVTTGVAAVTVGTVATAQSMAPAGIGVHSLVVASAAAGTVGGLAAMVLARRVRLARASLTATARRFEDERVELDDRGAADDREAPPPIREFAALAADLEATRERLARSRRRERELDAARRDLITWLSHDLRTPLAGIRALAEALEDGVAPDEATVARYRSLLGEQAERVADMVEDLFALSRIHSGSLALERTTMGLQDLLSDAVAGVEPLAARAQVRIEGRIEAAVDAEVSPLEMSRVLENLLSNAVRETPRGGGVSVRLARVPGWAQVTVADGCGGIAEEKLGRVFEPGFRGEEARSPEDASGAGLGLAIARGLAEAHGGTLAVRNVAGGCEFRLRLPLTEQAEPPRGAEPGRRPHPTLGTGYGHSGASSPGSSSA